MPKINETINSPHQSTWDRQDPQLIVLHIADGTYDGTKAWFMNQSSQTSSHFIVAKDGRICQCVSLKKMAWCNGTSTAKGESKYFGNSTVDLVRSLGGNANEYSVSIECEGMWSETLGALTDAQLEAVAWLVGYIQAEVKKIWNHTILSDRRYIVGHNEISPKTRPNCPGQKFPWDKLMAKLIFTPQPTTIYRVQLGAFGVKANAEALLDKLKAAGFEGIIVKGL